MTMLQGPNLYYVDDQGMRLKGEKFSVGSGSTYAVLPAAQLSGCCPGMSR